MAIARAGQDFRLSKWYLDAVCDDGAAFIGYAAHLHWHGLRLHYTGEIWSHAGEPTRARWSVRPTSAPVRHHDVVSWNRIAPGEDGRWQMIDAGYERRLHESAAGYVDWSCITPRAAVTLHTAAGCVRGTGYVERIHLTLPPWKLGLERLYWGRFHAPGHTITWIEWVGARPLRLAWHNGTLDETVTVTRDGLRLPASNATLAFAPARTIRDAPVLGTVLEALPILAPLTPAAFRAHEHKLVGAATLTRAHAEPVQGVALYEVVTW